MTLRAAFAAIFACALSSSAFAQATATPPPTPVASDLTRTCAANGGCVLTCMNQQGQSILTEQATRAVRIISLSNGNTEFRLDNGTAGVNVVLVSKDNLVCRLAGGT